MRRARITNWCGLVCLRMIVSSAWCCSFVNSMDAAANRAMLVSTSAVFIALQYIWYKLFRYPVLGPALLALAAFDAVKGKLAGVLVTFGRVPLAYYVAHLLLIHSVAVVVA